MIVKYLALPMGRIWVQRSCRLGVCLPSPSLIHSRTLIHCNDQYSQTHVKISLIILELGLECFQ